MPEKQVILTFATDSAPAALAARVIEVVVAEVAANLIGAHWAGFEIDDSDEQTECAHTAWEERPFRLVDGTPVASRKCSDCGTDLPTILLDGPQRPEASRA